MSSLAMLISTYIVNVYQQMFYGRKEVVSDFVNHRYLVDKSIIFVWSLHSRPSYYS